MSELLNSTRNEWDLRLQLRATVSSLTLLTSMGGIPVAVAEDNDHPIVWIELGADLERANDGQSAFAPAFVARNMNSPAFDPISPMEAQKPPNFSFGGEGKLVFQPEDSGWNFSASVRYGRANSSRHIHQERTIPSTSQHLIFRSAYSYRLFPTHYHAQSHDLLDAVVQQRESHVVVDFQAGKDVGLGLFGRGGTSVVSAGVRFAQFTTGAFANLKARPDESFVNAHFPQSSIPHLYGTAAILRYHNYFATATSARSFLGIGPSLSWTASTKVAGRSEDGELSFDWGMNAAILFGRQKANIDHQTSGRYQYKFPFYAGSHPHPAVPSYQNPEANVRRARAVVMPNAGGFAGVSYRLEDFKVAVGYRGDFFFGAMDTGFDTAKKSTVGFYGPFASVSVGIGG